MIVSYANNWHSYAVQTNIKRIMKKYSEWLCRKHHQYYKISQSMHIVGDTSK